VKLIPRVIRLMAGPRSPDDATLPLWARIRLCRSEDHLWDIDDGVRRTCRRCGQYEIMTMDRVRSFAKPSMRWVMLSPPGGEDSSYIRRGKSPVENKG
jgi:hypothetical protein